jgi:hypothetical protein
LITHFSQGFDSSDMLEFATARWSRIIIIINNNKIPQEKRWDESKLKLKWACWNEMIGDKSHEWGDLKCL